MDAHPESVSAAATYLQMLSYRKDWEKLLAECDLAFTRFPGETVFLEMKNIAYYNTEDYAGIIDNCQRVIDLSPGDTARTIPAMAMMGDMYYEMGAKKETFKLYKKVLKLDPDYVPVLNNYAYYLSLEGKQLKKAYAMSKKTIDKEPDNPTYLDTIGWILYRQGKLQEAKTYFKHAMLYGGKESATCLSHYATVLEALGETDLAKVYRSQAEAKSKEWNDEGNFRLFGKLMIAAALLSASKLPAYSGQRHKRTGRRGWRENRNPRRRSVSRAAFECLGQPDLIQEKVASRRNSSRRATNRSLPVSRNGYEGKRDPVDQPVWTPFHFYPSGAKPTRTGTQDLACTSWQVTTSARRSGGSAISGTCPSR